MKKMLNVLLILTLLVTVTACGAGEKADANKGKEVTKNNTANQDKPKVDKDKKSAEDKAVKDDKADDANKTDETDDSVLSGDDDEDDVSDIDLSLKGKDLIVAFEKLDKPTSYYSKSVLEEIIDGKKGEPQVTVVYKNGNDYRSEIISDGKRHITVYKDAEKTIYSYIAEEEGSLIKTKGERNKSVIASLASEDYKNLESTKVVELAGDKIIIAKFKMEDGGGAELWLSTTKRFPVKLQSLDSEGKVLSEKTLLEFKKGDFSDKMKVDIKE